MTPSIVLVALAAQLDGGTQPLTLFVRSVGGPDETTGAVWSQVLAKELRAYGIRVTTQSDLAAILSGQKQQQVMGCNDEDCGLDHDIMTRADAIVTTNVGAGDDALINIGINKNTTKLADARIAAEFVTVSRSDVPGGLKDLVPVLVEKLRAVYPDRGISAGPQGGSKEGGEPPKAKRCSVGGGEALVALAALLLVRRRSA